MTKSLETYNFLALPKLNKKLVVELARCEWITRRENVLALGNSGTGKTHIGLALGLAACQRGFRVRFTTAASLVHELIEARDERRLLRFQKNLARQSVLRTGFDSSKPSARPRPTARYTPGRVRRPIWTRKTRSLRYLLSARRPEALREDGGGDSGVLRVPAVLLILVFPEFAFAAVRGLRHPAAPELGRHAAVPRWRMRELSEEWRW